MQHNQHSINCNISDNSASFSIVSEHKIALSEISLLPQECAIDYLDMIEDPYLHDTIKDIIANSRKMFYYNRLNVPEKLRGKGLGQLLLQKTLEYCHDNNILLINTANNYGDMGQNNLIKFYEKNGMKLLHADGLLAYHKNLDYIKDKKYKI